MCLLTINFEKDVKNSCSENFVIFAENIRGRVYWKKFRYVDSQFLSKKVLCQLWFLRNSQNIQRDEQYKSGLLNVIKEGIMDFKYFNFNIDSYSFFVILKLLYARKLESKLFSMFCITVYGFLAMVQSPTCTTYGKFLLKSIMAMLTSKSRIGKLTWHSTLHS